MSASKIEIWIKNLGQNYDYLVDQGIINDQSLIEPYPGTDRLHLEPETGVDLGFWAETEVFETLCITLEKVMPSAVEYKGELPTPYSSNMTQSKVHAVFGEPFEVQAPIKMPQPMGQTGGWESYRLDPAINGNIKVVFKYTEAMEVRALIFTLIDKGHE